MQCQNLRNVPSTCSGSLQFATLGCVVNGPKIFAASIIRMEINMVKMNFPYRPWIHRDSRDITTFILKISKKWVQRSASRHGHFIPWERAPGTIQIGGEWTPEPFSIFSRREKSFRSAGIKIPDCPALSKATKPTSLALLPNWVWRIYFHKRKQAFRPPIHEFLSDHWPAMQATCKWHKNIKSRISIKMNHRETL
jgi:hypothetical protein